METPDGTEKSDTQMFKKFTSGELRRKIELDERAELLKSLSYINRKQKYKLWKDHFDDVYLEGIDNIQTKINYIHQNPVRKGMVEKAEDYPYSSAGYYATGIDSFLKVTNYLDAMGWGNHYQYGQIK